VETSIKSAPPSIIEKSREPQQQAQGEVASRMDYFASCNYNHADSRESASKLTRHARGTLRSEMQHPAAGRPQLVRVSFVAAARLSRS